MTLVPRRISRRTAIMWVVAVVPAAAGAKLLFDRAAVVDWPEKEWAVPAGPGYGKDPSLLEPAPWPNLLSDDQRATLATICDLIVPNDGISISASEAGVIDFVDEWVSSPYETTQFHRTTILNGVTWFNSESMRRYGKDYYQATPDQQADLFRDTFGKLARDGASVLRKIETRIDAESIRLAGVFLDTLHFLTVTGYYMTDAGRADIGYQGDKITTGDYEGPNDESLKHIRGVINQLGLPLPDVLG